MEREFKHEVLDLLWDETESLATHDEDERLKAAEQRLIATASQVNVASPRLNAAEQRVNIPMAWLDAVSRLG